MPPEKSRAGWPFARIVRLALALPDWIVRLDDNTGEAAAARAQGRIENLNAMVIEQGQRDPDLRGMGCTLTAARNLGRVLQIAHVGDSRAYLLRAGRLHQLTRDHTYVQMLVDSGLLSDAEAPPSRRRGTCWSTPSAAPTRACRWTSNGFRSPIGDRVLLCSDGLTDAVDDSDPGGAGGSVNGGGGVPGARRRARSTAAAGTTSR